MRARPITLTPAGIAATAAVFAAAALCVRLGFWQLHRLEARRAANAFVAERIDQPPLELSSAPSDTTGLPLRLARASGTWDSGRSVALAGRSRAGVPGVDVLTPLLVAGGGAILVDRGFVPSADGATVGRAGTAAHGPAVVSGRLRAFDPRTDVEASLRSRGPSSDTLPTWFARSPDGIGFAFPYELAPVYLVAEERTGDGPYPAPAPPPELGEGPHLGYAIQWFSFAAIALIGWGVMVARAASREVEG